MFRELGDASEWSGVKPFEDFGMRVTIADTVDVVAVAAEEMPALAAGSTTMVVLPVSFLDMHGDSLSFCSVPATHTATLGLLVDHSCRGKDVGRTNGG